MMSIVCMNQEFFLDHWEVVMQERADRKKDYIAQKNISLSYFC